MRGEEWTYRPDLIECIPDADARERYRERQLLLVEIDRRAQALFDEHGWAKMAAYAERLTNTHPIVRTLVHLGWFLDGTEGVLAVLNSRAKDAAKDDEDTAVMLRLLAITAASSGPPGDPNRGSWIVDVLYMMSGRLRLNEPTDKELDLAHVDAALESAARVVEWGPEAE